MGRPRRQITQYGWLVCTGCNNAKHISEFYCGKELYVCVRNQETLEEEWYGKPQSWCIACTKDYNRGKKALKESEQPPQIRFWDDLTPEEKNQIRSLQESDPDAVRTETMSLEEYRDRYERQDADEPRQDVRDWIPDDMMITPPKEDDGEAGLG